MEIPDSSQTKPLIVTLRLSYDVITADPKPRTMLVTQQASVANFNFRTFLGSFDDKVYVETKSGRATIGTIDSGSTRIASLVTNDDTWVLINAPLTVPVEDIRIVLTHLTPARR